MKVLLILVQLPIILLCFTRCNVDPYDQLLLIGDLNTRIPLPPNLAIDQPLTAVSDSVYFELDTLLKLENIDQNYLSNFRIEEVSLDTLYVNAGSLTKEFKSIQVYLYLDDLKDTLRVAELDTISATQGANLPLRVLDSPRLIDYLLNQRADVLTVDSLPNMAISFVFRDLTLNGNSEFNLSIRSEFRIVGLLDE